jgi:hypothetical protein
VDHRELSPHLVPCGGPNADSAQRSQDVLSVVIFLLPVLPLLTKAVDVTVFAVRLA